MVNSLNSVQRDDVVVPGVVDASSLSGQVADDFVDNVEIEIMNHDCFQLYMLSL